MLPGLPPVDPAYALNYLLAHDMGVWLVVFARIMGAFMIMPFWGSMNIPMIIRITIGAVVTMVLTPLVSDSVLPQLAEIKAGGNDGFQTIFLLSNQVLIGLAIGLVVAFVFYGIEAGGRIIDTQRGSQMSDIIAPQLGERTSTSGQFINMLAMVILVMSGMHMLILNALVYSFKVLPATLSMDWLNIHSITAIAEMSGNMMTIAVKVAAPAMISILLSDTLLGIINRGAPQVNVFMLSMPIKGVLGVAAMWVMMPFFFQYVQEDAIPGLFDKNNSTSIIHLVNTMRP